MIAVRLLVWKLIDGTMANYFATEEAIFAMKATKFNVVYVTVNKFELDEFGRISIAQIRNKRKLIF